MSRFKRKKTKKAKTKRWTWKDGVLLFVGMQALSAASTLAVKKAQGVKQDQELYYRGQKKPKFAPPGAVFGPIWLLNKVLDVAAIVHVLRQAPSPYRRRYLGIKACSSLIYSSFGAVYFGLRSPIGASNLTLSDWFLNISSLSLALKQGDRKSAWAHSTSLPWLSLASGVSLCVALWNPDPLFKTPRAVEPPEKWVKPESPGPVSRHAESDVIPTTQIAQYTPRSQ